MIESAIVSHPKVAESAVIGRDVRTINGSIELKKGTTVSGDIVIEDSQGKNERRRPLRIELNDGSVVQGNVIVEDPDLEVEVYLRGGSKVLGRIENAKVIEG